jgi:hypothetical protein
MGEQLDNAPIAVEVDHEKLLIVLRSRLLTRLFCERGKRQGDAQKKRTYSVVLRPNNDFAESTPSLKPNSAWRTGVRKPPSRDLKG